MFAAMPLDILVVIWIRDAPSFGLARAKTKETHDTIREARTIITVNFMLSMIIYTNYQRNMENSRS
jgi:hypothetical protein